MDKEIIQNWFHHLTRKLLYCAFNCNNLELHILCNPPFPGPTKLRNIFNLINFLYDVEIIVHYPKKWQRLTSLDYIFQTFKILIKNRNIFKHMYLLLITLFCFYIYSCIGLTKKISRFYDIHYIFWRYNFFLYFVSIFNIIISIKSEKEY